MHLAPESPAATHAIAEEDETTPRPATTFAPADQLGDAATEVTPPIAGGGPAAPEPSTWSPPAPGESGPDESSTPDESDETATVEGGQPDAPSELGDPHSTWEREERNAGS